MGKYFLHIIHIPIAIGTAFLIFNSFCFSQNSRIDSLVKCSVTQPADSGKVNTLNRLAEELRIKDPVKASAYASEALTLSQKINFEYGEAMAYYYLGNTATNMRKFDEALIHLQKALDKCNKVHSDPLAGRIYNTMGIINEMKGNYSEARGRYLNALRAFTEIHDIKKMAACRFNVANTYRYQGNYPLALKYHFEALREREQLNDKSGIAASLNSIGLIYSEQKDLKRALKNYLEALKINRETGDKTNELQLQINIGTIYKDIGNYNEALIHFNAALKICEEVNYAAGIADSYIGIGNVYKEKGDGKNAIANFSKALKIHENANDSNGIALGNGCLSSAYIDCKNYQLAIKHSAKCLEISKRINIPEFALRAEEVLYRSYDSLNDKRKAYDHFKSYIAIRDTLFNEENTKKTVQLQMNYEFDKKEAETKAEQDKKDAVTKIVIYSISGGLFLVLVLAGFVFRSFRQKQKANIIITQQKEEVEKQKNLVEEKQKDILDSIHYAKRIQQSLMPMEKYIEKNLKRLIQN